VLQGPAGSKKTWCFTSTESGGSDPGEIKRREVMLDPQVSPKEIKRREVELGLKV